MDENDPGGLGTNDAAASLFGPDTNVAEIGSVVAAAGARSLASYVAKSAPAFLAGLRKEPFLYNLWFSGVFGDHQAAGLRISNPHPDVIYLRNAILDNRTRARLKVACVLRGDHDRPRSHEPRPEGISMGTAPPWFQDGQLTDSGWAANQLEVMDRYGIAVAPLQQVDLCFYFARRHEGNAFEGGEVTLDLAAEGYRSKVSNTAISFYLRHQPLR